MTRQTNHRHYVTEAQRAADRAKWAHLVQDDPEIDDEPELDVECNTCGRVVEPRHMVNGECWHCRLEDVADD